MSDILTRLRVVTPEYFYVTNTRVPDGMPLRAMPTEPHGSGLTIGLVREAIAEIERLRSALTDTLAALAIAMDGLESDSDLDFRRRAFEIAQDRFENLTSEENQRYEAAKIRLWDQVSDQNTEEPTR